MPPTPIAPQTRRVRPSLHQPKLLAYWGCVAWPHQGGLGAGHVRKGANETVNVRKAPFLTSSPRQNSTKMDTRSREAEGSKLASSIAPRNKSRIACRWRSECRTHRTHRTKAALVRAPPVWGSPIDCYLW